MAIKTKFKEVEFGVGDKIRLIQRIKEGGKERQQIFEGMVIGIKGREMGKSVTLRRIGEGQIGIEKIVPLNAPNIVSIEVKKQGGSGIRHAKLYFTRGQSKKDIERIYIRSRRKALGINAAKKRKS